MRVVDKISVTELRKMAERMYGSLVKADVDIAKKMLIVDMEMHADGEAELLQNGSKQADLWGINLYPDKFGSSDFVVFDSMINIKPRQNNMNRGIDDPKVRKQIIQIVDEVVHE
jgi:hypothetical protein